jgi:ribose transport system ATP-binding protein
MNALVQSGARSEPPFVSVKSLAKSFGGAQALKNVSLSVLSGETHGLVGANGAGKSTFIRILAGLIRPDGGEILIDGGPLSISDPHFANELGLSFIHQELAFVSGMTVLQNIMLGLPKRTRFGMVDWRSISREVRPIADRVGLTAPLGASVKGLSTAENWLINITRALVRKARLIVMDEPTAALSTAECTRLFDIIRDLKRSGVAVLYVSHRLDEILELCQRVTVFRDGCSVNEFDRAQLTRQELVEAIIGRSIEQAKKSEHRSSLGTVALSARGLARYPKVKDVSFDLRHGEVLGLGGLVGAGRSELARLLFGADRPDQGAMTLDGKAFAPRRCSEAVDAGLGLVPEERRSEGLFLSKSIAFNLSLVSLDALVVSRGLPLIARRRWKATAEKTMRDLAIKASSLDALVAHLSGGNQQKVLIARWLQASPKVLILDEPTRGVDVGSRSEIHRLVRELARKGMAVLVISSEPEELPDLCDRVLVMVEGRIVAELSGGDLTRDRVIGACYADVEETRSI